MKFLKSPLLIAAAAALALAACSSTSSSTTTTTDSGAAVDASAAATDANATTGPDTSNAVAVDNVEMHKDNGSGDPGDTTSTFKPTDGKLIAVVHLNHPKAGTKVGVSLVAMGFNNGKDVSVVSDNQTTGAVDNTVTEKFTLPKPWPVSKYRVDVMLNGQLAKSTTFEVTNASQ